MNGREFVRKIKKLAKERGVFAEFRKERGKGDHGTLYFGQRLRSLAISIRNLKPEPFMQC
jgi:mRNA interferase HicA